MGNIYCEAIRFHLNPGKYEIRSVSPSNCYFFQKIELSAEAPKSTVEVKLKGDRNPAYWSEAPYIPSPYWGGHSMPYWGLNGNLFSNFNYPGPWLTGGISPGFFPGGGNFAAAKPNLYVSVTKKQNLKISIDYANVGTRWLASIPAVKDNGWQLEVNPAGGLKIGDASYPYIFYDYRGYDENLQNTEGFCEPREKAIDHMISLLKEAKYRPSEVRDFDEYWRIKMPPVEQLCVFPQTEKQLNKTAKIKSSPVPRSLTRRLFIVVPKDKGVYYGKAKFLTEPLSAWTSEKNTATQNFKSDVELREWGVAFLFSQ